MDLGSMMGYHPLESTLVDDPIRSGLVMTFSQGFFFVFFFFFHFENNNNLGLKKKRKTSSNFLFIHFFNSIFFFIFFNSNFFFIFFVVSTKQGVLVVQITFLAFLQNLVRQRLLFFVIRGLVLVFLLLLSLLKSLVAS